MNERDFEIFESYQRINITGDSFKGLRVLSSLFCRNKPERMKKTEVQIIEETPKRFNELESIKV